LATKLFVALDYPDAKSALSIYKKLNSLDLCFKVGLELFTSEGPDFVRQLVDNGSEVFLDLKFHDIPNTVARAVAAASKLGVAFTNIHLLGGEEMVRAAVAETGKTKLLGVTVMTSTDKKTLQSIGLDKDPASWVVDLAKKGKAWGVDGVVCSALEVPAVAKTCGKDFFTVVGGVRPAGSDDNDQKRIATPAAAKKAGVHYIVVGRPITQAKDPVKAAKEILRDIQ
jgi:orotidine-5'-phosphate decarboxylase